MKIKLSLLASVLLFLCPGAYSQPGAAVTPASFSLTVSSCNDSSDIALKIRNTGNANLTYKITPSPLSGILDTVLGRINRRYSSLTALVPNIYLFSDGITGNQIGDGGNDMYDGGNILNTNRAGSISYSNNAINTSSSAFGTSGKYFTLKQPGLFVMAADVNDISSFYTSGNNGADGSGGADGAVLTVTWGGSVYKGFVKRVFGAWDPSINQLVIIKDNGAAGHTFATNTNDGQHTISNLSGVTRLYYLLYASADGGYVDDAVTKSIMMKFLEIIDPPPSWFSVSPYNGLVLAGDSVTATLTLKTRDLVSGTYNRNILIYTNDPANPVITVPLSFTVAGSPKIVLPGSCMDLDSIMESSVNRDTLVISNTGCDTLRITNITSSSGAFTVDRTAFKIDPFSSSKVCVTFIPSSAGTFTGTLSISNNDVNSGVCVTGKGYSRPVAEVIPSSMSATISSCNDSITQSLKIRNRGAGNLNFGLSPNGLGLIGDTSILVIQNNTAWGVNVASMITSTYGVTPTVIGYTQIASTDFSQYDLIITSGDQSSAYYSSISGNVSKFGSFVNSGGIVLYLLGDYSGNTVNLPGGAQLIYGFQETYNTVALASHPVVSGLPVTLRGDDANSSYLSSLPAGATVITRTLNSGYPTTAEYSFGKGRVIATGMIMEYLYNYSYNSGPLLPNSIQYAISLIKVTPRWLSLSATSDTLSGGDSVTVNVKFKSTGFNSGTYTTNLYLNSNDPVNPSLAVPFTFRLIGSPKIALSDTCMNLDSIMEARINRDTLLVSNQGCDTLKVTGISSSSGSFSVDKTSFNVLPGKTEKVCVTFAPASAGTFTGNLTISNNSGNKIVCLSGKAFPKPVISVYPDSLPVTVTGCDDSLTVYLKIRNTGPGELDFNIKNSLTGQPAPAACMPATTGYCCNMGIYNVTFNTINNTTSNGIEGYRDYSSFQSTNVLIGQSYQLSVRTGTTYNENVLAWIDYNNNGIFEASEKVLQSLNTFQNHSATVTVPMGALQGIPVRMRIASDYAPNAAPTSCANVQYGQVEDYAVIINGGYSISPVRDTLSPGDSSLISIRFRSRGLNVGSYNGSIFIDSNDPLNPALIIPTYFTIIGAPEISLSSTCFDLDSIMAYTVSRDTLTITNTGCDTLKITGITSSASVFAADKTRLNIGPSDSGKIGISFSPVTAGNFTGNLNISSNGGDTSVCLSGKAYPRPDMVLAPDSVTVILPCHDSTIVPVTIRNNGQGRLIFTLNGTQNNPVAAGCTPGTTNYCCNMGIYNVSFNSINNTTGNGSEGYRNFTSVSTKVIAGETYAFYVKTGSTYNEHVRAWIDYNNNGTFEASEKVFQSVNTFVNHSGNITIPMSAVSGVPLRMRVGSDYNGQPYPEPCTNAFYGQFEDYTVYIESGSTVPTLTDTLSSGDSVTVNIKLSSEGLINSVYRSFILVNSNDPLHLLDTIPVKLTVVGAPNLSLSAACLARDSIMQYTSGSNTLKVFNTGCDTLSVTNVTAGTSFFAPLVTSLQVLPGDTGKIAVIFSPVGTGDYRDTLRVFSNDGTMKVCLGGYAFPRPVAETSPDSLHLTMAACCDSVIVPLKVRNTGGSNLNYDIAVDRSVSGSKIKVAVFNDNGTLLTVLNSQPDIAATYVSTYDASVLSNYDVLMNIRGSNLNQTAVLNFINNGGAWIGEWTSNAYPVTNWGAVSGTLSGSGTGGSQSVNILIPDNYLATHINWAGITPGTDPADFMRDLRGISDPAAKIIATVNHTSYPNNPLLVEKKYGKGKIILFNWDYKDSPNFNAHVADMIQEVVRYAGDRVKWLSSVSGADTLLPGDSATVNMKFRNCDMNPGTYSTNILINSNDPLNRQLAVPVVLTIDSIPAAPAAAGKNVCYGQQIPPLTATGSNIRWYSDSLLTSRVFAGDTFPSNDTVPGTYVYYATQTVNGCEGKSRKVKLIINGVPSAPGVPDVTVCAGDPVPPFIASGENILWFGDAHLTNRVHSGDTLKTGRSNVGTYVYYVADSTSGCPTGPSAAVTLSINSVPSAPAGHNVTVCYGNTVSPLTADGSLITWYGDSLLSTVVGSGNSFQTGKTAPGIYEYYATQKDTVSFCESRPAKVTLVIIQTPLPAASDKTVCVGSTIPALTAIGTNIKWYSDSALTSLADTTASFNTGHSQAGVYTYYATQTANGCQSLSRKVKLSINAIPSAPVSQNVTVCEGVPTPNLSTSGSNVKWYSDSALSVLVFSGTSYATGITAPGTYKYYLTQTVNGCTSPQSSVVLGINALPAAPAASGATICSGQPTPDLSATGSNVTWYGNAALTDTVFQGNVFSTGRTAPGIYTYYATQTLSNCRGPARSVVLTINTSPVVSAADKSSCFGSAVPSLTATGSNVRWNNNTGLVHSGNTFNTGHTAPGTYTYFVSDSVAACPRGPADTVKLTINPVPSKPVSSDVTVCFGVSTPDLSASGSNVKWYSDAALTMLSYSGNTFPTGKTAAGVYTYYASSVDSVTGCKSSPDTVLLTINSSPAPAVTGATACVGGTIPNLVSAGTGVKWYSDAQLSSLAGTGNSFATGQTAAGTYTYYATQTLNGCESPSSSATLVINTVPAAPSTSDYTVCSGGAIPNLVAAGTGIKWYSDASLATLVHSGSSFATGRTVAGTYTYYATQTINGCQGASSVSRLTINPTPAAPSSSSISVCFGTATPDLTASGSDIKWYSDAALTTLVFSGSPYATGRTAVGTYNYYVTQSSGNCQSAATNTVLTINAIPTAPVTSNKNACSGSSVPSLTATGNNIKWFSDNGLGNQVGSGNAFATGKTVSGTYTYYATQTVNGCSGASASAVLTINETPSAPSTSNVSTCLGDPTPDLSVPGGPLVRWYSDAALTNVVASGNTYATGKTAAGVYTYYVTRTINSCQGPSVIVNLTINSTGAPVTSSPSVCSGSATPNLTATGSNIQWYSDAGLTTQVGSGNSYASGQTAVGTYTYYATQTVNGCKGPAATAVLSIGSVPSAPVVTSASMCSGASSAALTATGTSVRWYSDAGLTAQAGTGSSYISPETASGTYTYYATQTANGCQGPAASATLTIKATPASPQASDVTICSGTPTPALTATGTNVQWYSDVDLTIQVATGSSFATGKTAVGTYVYYVTQTVNDCKGPAKTVTLKINETAAPVTSGASVCAGAAVPDLTASGTAIKWYSNAALSTQVGTGSTFATGKTVPGTYTYYSTQTVGGCESPAAAATLTIKANPSAPAASDVSACATGTIPGLSATGNLIKWYGDPGLSNLLSSGSSFNTGQTLPGTYTYYATQTFDGCVSPAKTVQLTVFSTPAPAGANASVCAGSTIPDLVSTGSNINWYSDAGLTALVHTGNTFATGKTAAGTYTYYTTQTVSGCKSSASALTLTINPKSSAPSATGVTVCAGGAIPDLAASGINVKWYSDAALSAQAATGNSFATGRTAPGSYTYYCTQTANGCESSGTPVTLTINAIPAAPAASDISVCSTSPVPSLTATGTSVKWYGDPGQSTVLFTGNTFNTGQTLQGTYTYYATQTVNGCEGPSRAVHLTIYTSPLPVAANASICSGAPVPDLTSSGTGVQWYSDAGLTSQVGSGNIFSTGKTAPGVYTYYLTQTVGGCKSPAATATLTINPQSVTPSSSDVTVCEGDIIPDLTATGVNIRWYNNGTLSGLEGTGNSFASGQTLPGNYTYYATETTPGCQESPPAEVKLTIKALPQAPASSDVSACSTNPIPALTATGTNISWYADSTLTTLVSGGSSFNTGNVLPGVYTYYATQSINGCEGPARQVRLSIYDSPLPVVSDISVCSGSSVPDLSASGSNIEWYADAGLGTLVNTGNTFSTGKTGPGTYTYYVTQTVGGCKSPAASVTLTINPKSNVPVSADVNVCSGDAIPPLTATGTNIRWYSDAALTAQAGSGNSFTTGQTGAGAYTYYVTETTPGCQESPAAQVILTIHAIPSAPVAADLSFCSTGTISPLTASGSSVRWYADSLLNQLTATGNSFSTGNTLPGTYSYYVTQTVNGCESPYDRVNMTIYSSPAPVASDVSICSGTSVPDLSATGTNVQWYSDPNLTVLVSTGNTFASGQTVTGQYTYYVTQTVGGCKSPSSVVTLTILPQSVPPVTSGATICDGSSVPALTASGVNLKWYSDAGLTNLVGSGSSFATGHSAPGSFIYYVTETTPGCQESPATAAVLTINPIPSAPAAVDKNACSTGIIPDLTATGSDIRWYADSLLSSFLSGGNAYATGITSDGVYRFYVTQSVLGCESPYTKVTLGVYSSSQPVASDVFICYGTAVPDLSAAGTDVKWYSDSALTALVGSGNSFATGQTAVGVYRYYVTQTIGGCRSTGAPVTLTINPTSVAPLAGNASSCEGQSSPVLTATGTALRWYGDAGLSTLVGSGNNFNTGQTLAGTYTYYVTQTVSGCLEGPATPVTLTIHARPALPLASDKTACAGGVIPPLTATGAGLRWYSDSLITKVDSGSTFNTGLTAQGIYLFYVSQTDITTGCMSAGLPVKLYINPVPSEPSASDVSACSGSTIPGLSATGDNVKWYSDSLLTQVGSGNTFVTGLSAAGTYVYYVSQTVSGCESPGRKVVLYINPVPAAPAASNASVCYGSHIPDLNASGDDIRWYSDPALTSYEGGGMFLSTGKTAPGLYLYYATQTVNGCEGPAAMASLMILPRSAMPVTLDTAVCFGGTIPALYAEGSNIRWYSDMNLTILLKEGNVYPGRQTKPGLYTFYVTQDTNGCASLPGKISLTINPKPLVTANSYSVSLDAGDTIPLLGFNAKRFTWYPSEGLNTDTGAVVLASPAASRTYTLTGYSDKGCSQEVQIEVNVRLANAITPAGKEGKIIIYPNPASEMLNIDMLLLSRQKVTVNVLNLLGQSILSRKTDDISDRHNIRLDLADMKQGVYNIQLIGEEGVITTRRIIISR